MSLLVLPLFYGLHPYCILLCLFFSMHIFVSSINSFMGTIQDMNRQLSVDVVRYPKQVLIARVRWACVSSLRFPWIDIAFPYIVDVYMIIECTTAASNLILIFSGPPLLGINLHSIDVIIQPFIQSHTKVIYTASRSYKGILNFESYRSSRHFFLDDSTASVFFVLDDLCMYCQQAETAEHTILSCDRWELWWQTGE